MLNVEQQFYFHRNKTSKPTEWVGAVVKVHRPKQVPMPETGGVRLEPRTQTKILAKRVRNIAIF